MIKNKGVKGKIENNSFLNWENFFLWYKIEEAYILWSRYSMVVKNVME